MSLEEAEAILFTNLSLLGFDPKEQQRLYKVSIQPDMFRRANQKGMEVVLYFLLRCVIPEDRFSAVCFPCSFCYAHSFVFQGFQMIWPCHEKAQQRDFKKVSLHLLQELEQAGHIPPRTALMSHLQNAGGDRFACSVPVIDELDVCFPG